MSWALGGVEGGKKKVTYKAFDWITRNLSGR